MNTNKTRLDAESVRAARDIYNGLLGQQVDPETISQCPIGTGDVKARYYGTAAWIIDLTLADVFHKYVVEAYTVY